MVEGVFHTLPGHLESYIVSSQREGFGRTEKSFMMLSQKTMTGLQITCSSLVNTFTITFFIIL